MFIQFIRISIIFLLIYAGNIYSYSRVITLSPHLTEWMIELGLSKLIVGGYFLEEQKKNLLNPVLIGDHKGINIEAIILLKPDFILVWETGITIKEKHQLTLLNIPLFYSNPKFIKDIPKELLKIQKLFKKKSIKAEYNINQHIKLFYKKLSVIKHQYQSLKKKKVFIQLWIKPIISVSQSSWLGNVLNICNAESIIDNKHIEYPQISLENIIYLNPDVILIPNENKKNNWKQFWIKQKHILAVKENKIYQYPSKQIHRFSMNLLNDIDNLCKIIHG